MSSPSFAAPPVRLTRRGRVTVVAVVLAALCGAGSLAGHAAASAGGTTHVHQVTVRAGETLWELANRIAPHADPRVVVAQLQQVNHISGGTVAAGQRLVVSGVSAG